MKAPRIPRWRDKRAVPIKLLAFRHSRRESAARNNLHDLQPIAGFKLAMGKFRRRHGVAVVFHHHAAREKILRDEKCFDRAGEICFDWLAVGGDERIHGLSTVFELLSKTISSVSPNMRLSPAEVIVNRFVDMKVNL